MAYQTGTASDINDLATTLATFLGANGWTVNRNDSQGTGRRLQVGKGSQRINLRFLNNEALSVGLTVAQGYGVMATPADTYASGNDWYNQDSTNLAADATTRMVVAMPTASGSMSYHFFTQDSDDTVWVVVQKTGHVWNYLGWGASLTKAGAWTGGRFLVGCRSSSDYVQTFTGSQNDGILVESLPPGHMAGSIRTMVRINPESFGDLWQTVVATLNSASGNGKLLLSSITQSMAQGHNGDNKGIFTTDVLVYRGKIGVSEGIVPVDTLLSIKKVDTTFAPIGRIPGACGLRSAGQFSDGSEETIGSDTYLVFSSFAVLKDA